MLICVFWGVDSLPEHRSSSKAILGSVDVRVFLLRWGTFIASVYVQQPESLLERSLFPLSLYSGFPIVCLKLSTNPSGLLAGGVSSFEGAILERLHERAH